MSRTLVILLLKVWENPSLIIALYLTIRKSFSKVSSDSNQISSLLQQTKVREDKKVGDLEVLITKVKSLEASNRSLQNDFEEATNECEECYKTIEQLKTKIKSHQKLGTNNIHKKDEIIEQLKKDKDTLESELEVAEKNWKNVTKLIKTKEK